MRLVFPGTGGFHPNERRHTASVLFPELGIALDAGTGFFRVPALLKTRSLDIVLSHSHLDHVCGLSYCLVPVLRGEIETVRVHATEATIKAVREHIFAPAIFPVDPPFVWLPFPNSGTLSLGPDIELRWRPLEHPGGSTGFVLGHSGKRVAYITDTTAPGDYADFVHNVDLLIHECYFPDEQHDWAVKTGHSSASCVARIAEQAQVRQLILVHADPQDASDDPVGIDRIRAIFPNTLLAEDRLEITL